ncbi:hypothetical protein M404DRAFT_31855 [Pisolithus tinctorius Marx 270]|uniref:Uncharacterized protein n=1 Tax=Pisolithus tinctorius Marx 270 TaxID=870435 RepID=A0A0C3NA02_PISTI|nr:hypothetical protein M404DRAFT_31855 [Pisolithus tinctorius Marx 270]
MSWDDLDDEHSQSLSSSVGNQVCKDKGLPEGSLATFSELEDPKLMMISLMAFQNAELSNKISVFIKENLAMQWSIMKQKISNSITNKANISVLARLLMGPGPEITKAHWHSCFINFQMVIEESKAVREAIGDEGTNDEEQLDTECTWNMTNFWKYVDCLMQEIIKEAHNEGTPVECQRFINTFAPFSPQSSHLQLKCPNRFYHNTLKSDLLQFPAEDDILTPPFEHVMIKWHKVLQGAMAWA